MSSPGKIRALLATLRIANAPSVVSNVFLGWVLGIALAIHPDAYGLASSLPFLVCLAGLLLYFAGNLANDWYDRAWDEERRPERALPSGLFKPRSYLAASLLCASGGCILAFRESLACGFCALGILVCIAIYTRYHKQAIWAVIPMGLCRAGLYALGMASILQDPRAAGGLGVEPWKFALGYSMTLAPYALGLFCYIAGLSLSARYEGMENAPPGPRLISKCLIALPLLAMPCLTMAKWPVICLLGMIPFAVWLALSFTRYAKPIPVYVSALLAGIPLVDLIALTPIAWWEGKLEFLAVPLVAFVTGRALQKLAPAT